MIAVQKLFGLPATGVVDEPTWDQINSTYLTILNALPPEWDNAVILFPGRFLVEGMQGDDVRQLQEMLAALSTGLSGNPAHHIRTVSLGRRPRKRFSPRSRYSGCPRPARSAHRPGRKSPANT